MSHLDEVTAMVAEYWRRIAPGAALSDSAARYLAGRFKWPEIELAMQFAVLLTKIAPAGSGMSSTVGTFDSVVGLCRLNARLASIDDDAGKHRYVLGILKRRLERFDTFVGHSRLVRAQSYGIPSEILAVIAASACCWKHFDKAVSNVEWKMATPASTERVQ